MSSKDNADYLMQAATNAGMTDRRELANFMGQMQVESGGFARMDENLNYSGARLLEVFPGRNGMNDRSAADRIAAGGPEAVANAIYGGSWGKRNLGNIEPGDGWKYHGRGYVQLTGRDNYDRLGKEMGLDLVNHPELAADRDIAAKIAIHYWQARVVSHDDQRDVTAAGQDINGGSNGLADRKAATSAWEAKLDRGYTPGTPEPTRHAGAAHTTLREGDHGHSVTTLQEQLARLGYKDTHGRSIAADGDFGPNTLRAVQAFQRDHHLTVDGKVGSQTQAAIDQALKAKHDQAHPPLTDPRSPDHVLFEQALAGVKTIDAKMGRTSDQQSINLAASLVAPAKAAGLTRIDQVALSEDGSHTFVAQNGVGIKTYADVATAQGVNTSVEKSSAAAQAIPAPIQGTTQTLQPSPAQQPSQPGAPMLV